MVLCAVGDAVGDLVLADAEDATVLVGPRAGP
jgi:hypothetical protein